MAGLFDDIVAHQIGIERAKAGEIKRVREIIEPLDNRILLILNSLPQNYTQGQLNAAIFKISEITEKFYNTTMQSAYNRIGRTTVSIEVNFAVGIIKKYLTLTPKKVNEPKRREVFATGIQTLYQGRTLPNWTTGLGNDKTNRVVEAVRNVAVEAGAVNQIVAAARNALGNANNNADTITRTYINQFTNTSRDATYQENPDDVDVIIWSSILDHRTTITCGVRSNQKFDAATKAPIGHDNLWEGGPGVIHFNCRSIGIPVNKEGIIVGGTAEGQKFDEGSRTAIGGTEDFERGDGATADGKVVKLPGKNNELEKQIIPADVTYETWLREQPRAFVEDVLGKGKAKLFINEKISLDRFAVPDGRELTLEQLENQIAA